jgi:serine/threonine protein kinase
MALNSLTAMLSSETIGALPRLRPGPRNQSEPEPIAKLGGEHSPLSAMKTLGKFEILEKIGQGAMGTVYKARDPFIGRLVALKTITKSVTEDSAALERFYQEARSAGALQHPNIVTIFELGNEDDTPFIAMEYLEGVSLDKLIESRPVMTLSQQLGYVVHVCRALEYAHKRGVIHRDVKPGNVMVTKDGTVKVVDFGIARLIESSHSQTGTLVGTLCYMSPQQLRGTRADARSDIWAAGAMFYEILAHRRPFDGENYGAVMMSILTEEVPPLSKTAPGTPLDVAAVVNRMLQKDVEARFQSMEEVLIDLEPCWKRLQQTEVSGLLADAHQLFKARNFENALDAVRRILQIDNENTEARNLLEQTNAECRRSRTAPQEIRSRDSRESPAGAGQSLWETDRGATEPMDPDLDSEATLGPDANFTPVGQSETKGPPPLRAPVPSRSGAAAAPALSRKEHVPAQPDIAAAGVPVHGEAEHGGVSASPAVPWQASQATIEPASTEPARSARISVRPSPVPAVESTQPPAPAVPAWWQRPVPIFLTLFALAIVLGAGVYFLLPAPPDAMTSLETVAVNPPPSTLSAAAAPTEVSPGVSADVAVTDLERQQRFLITSAVDAADRAKDYRVALALLERARALNGPLQSEIARYRADYERLAASARNSATDLPAPSAPAPSPQPAITAGGGALREVTPPADRPDTTNTRPASTAVAVTPRPLPAVPRTPPAAPPNPPAAAAPPSNPATAVAPRPAPVITQAPPVVPPNSSGAVAPGAASALGARAEESVAPTRTAPEPPSAVAASIAPTESPDRQAIRASIEQLSAAFSHRSMAELQEVWPKVGGNVKNNLKTVFDTASSLSREFHVQSLTIANDGATATVIGTYDGKIRLGRGAETVSNGNFYVRLAKRNAKWSIDDASF